MKKNFTLCFDRSVIERFSFRCGRAGLLLVVMAASVFMFSMPAFAYEEDTHFNMTYVICRSVGFTDAEAMIVAAVDQGMDDSSGTVANGGTGGIIPNVDQEWMWHALDGYGYVDGGSMHASGIIARRDQLFQYALNEPDPRNRLILLGVFFHFQQDTWGHRHHYDANHLSQNNYTTYNTPWGHALDYHQPDRPPFDPVAAMMDLEAGVVFARTFLKQAIGRAPGTYLATYTPQGGSVDTSWSQEGKYYHQISLAGAAPNSSRLYLLSLLQAQINAYTCSTDPYYGFRCTANEANVNNVRLALQTVAQNFEQYRSGGIPNPTINIPTTAQKVAAGFTNMTSVYITNMFAGTARFVAIGTDKNLYKSPTLPSGWVQVPNSQAVIGITALPDGSILGVGTDKFLWRRATLSSNWVQVPNSGLVTAVTVMLDGTILGVGTDKFLYQRATLNANWVQVPNSGSVTGVAIMADGSILGIGTEQGLWTRATLSSNWVQVPNSGAVIAITVMADGSIVGVGTDNFLWRRATLTSSWVRIPNTGVVTGVTAMLDGSLLGIGTEQGLWQLANLHTGWIPIPNSGLVTAITPMPDGSLLGIGTDKFLYQRANLNSNWVQVPNSGSVVSIAVMQDGSILGVGTDSFLWRRATLNSNWVQVPNSGVVSGVAVMPDGSILGIGTEKGLWRRANLNSNWVQIPNSGLVTAITVMADGSILGVGTDNFVWRRANLNSNWVKILNSNAVIDVAVMP